MKHILPVMLGCVLLGAACTKTTKPDFAVISGLITVDPDFDSTPDFSGIELLIVVSGLETAADTLFFAVTDSLGRFSGVSNVPESGVYPMSVSRNSTVLALPNVILATGDTITLTGMLPDLGNTLQIVSPENDAYQTLQRVQRNYNRVQAFIQNGSLPPDTIPDIIRTWSDIFWSMRQAHPHTFAARLAAVQSVELLDGWHDTTLIARLDSLEADPLFFAVKVFYGSAARVRVSGLEYGLEYLESIKKTARDADERITVDMRTIEVLALMQEYDRAVDALRVFLARKDNTEYHEWATQLVYEIENLLPGRVFPQLEITLNNGAVFTTDGFTGKPFMLEVMLVTDRRYQNGYTQLTQLYEQAQAAGVEFISVPAENRQALVDAFFEERGQKWPVAVAGQYQQAGLAATLQITQAPVRFLVGADGRIVGRYFGNDLTALENDLTTHRFDTIN